jgi:Fic family protein
MKKLPLLLLSDAHLEAFKAAVGAGLAEAFSLLSDSPLSAGSFSFYTSVSAVFSSKIEGEPIELDSYIKHKRVGAHFLPDYTRKIDDLYAAYSFVQSAAPTAGNLHEAHRHITANILSPGARGAYRRGNMYVTTPDGRIEYVAAAPDVVPSEMEKLWIDVALLQEAELSTHEAFYFAALLHLRFVKIHPYEDGNGRAARLLEKWFLAQKLGPKAWYLRSEQHYYDRHATYYRNLRALGLEYETLDWSKALPALLMLPDALAADNTNID